MWHVEFGTSTLELLSNSLWNEMNLSSDEIPRVWFYDRNDDVMLANEI
jgi:hypothetical protein